MARKGILTSGGGSGDQSPSPAPKPQPQSAKPRGAIGALQSSLSKLQENAIQDIDVNLIDGAGVEDRLGFDSDAHKQLVESLRIYGQQVPVLLRPHPDKPQRFEIVYGRRRLKALRELGLPVKAMIRQLDDEALVLAQGQENTSRQDLSFIEKASFAAQLASLDYDRKTIADALSIDLPMVSRLLKVGTAFDLEFLKKIGSAPSIGRDRWMTLIKLMETASVRHHALKSVNLPDFMGNSDQRFEFIFQRAQSFGAPAKDKTTPAKPRALCLKDGRAIGGIRSSAKGVMLNIPAKGAGGFDTWINANADDLLAELHARFEQSRKEEQ